MPLKRYVPVYVVRRWSDRFALYFEWAGLPAGVGMLAGTVGGMWWLPTQRTDWFCLVQAAIALAWISVGTLRPIHKRFGFSRTTRFVSPSYARREVANENASIRGRDSGAKYSSGIRAIVSLLTAKLRRAMRRGPRVGS